MATWRSPRRTTLDVDAVGVDGSSCSGGRPRSRPAERLLVVDERDGVRVADVDVDGRPGHRADRHLGLGEQLALAEVDGDGVALEEQRLDAVAGGDVDRAGRVDQALLDQVTQEHPDPVAAHLRGPAVGVAVVHEPLDGLVGAFSPMAAVRITRSTPSAPDPGPAVAQGAHPLRAQLAVDGPVVVGQQHEVVLVPCPFKNG